MTVEGLARNLEAEFFPHANSQAGFIFPREDHPLLAIACTVDEGIERRIRLFADCGFDVPLPILARYGGALGQRGGWRGTLRGVRGLGRMSW